MRLKPSSDESVELRRDEKVRGSAEPPRVALSLTASKIGNEKLINTGTLIQKFLMYIYLHAYFCYNFLYSNLLIGKI